MGLFSRKKIDVRSPEVVQASAWSDGQLSLVISGLPTSVDPQPTAGVYRNDPAAWEVRVRACRELHAFREQVLTQAAAPVVPDGYPHDWATDVVTQFGDALQEQAASATRSPDYRLMVEQGAPVDATVITNLIRPNIARALGGIGLADHQERRVHKVADRVLLSSLIGIYLEAGGQRGYDALLAYGTGWSMCRWITWSDEQGLVVDLD